MPRPSDPTTRRRILDAATALFYARGVQAVGTADIVAAARCGKNALYRHFPTKDALVAAYLEDFAAFRDRHMDEAVAAADGPAEALVALTEELAQQAARPVFRGCAVRRCHAMVGLDDVAVQAADRALASWRERIAGLVSDLGRPPELADRIWLVHDGVYGATDPAAAGRTAVGLVKELVG